MNTELKEKINPSVRIRPATTEDIPNIEISLRESWEMHLENEPNLFDADRLRSSNIVKYYNEALESPDSTVLVAEVNNAFAGFIKVDVEKIQPWFKYNQTLWIDDVCVRNDFRRQGVARSLVMKAEEEARNRNIHRIQARIYSFNEPIKNLLTSLGYDLPYMTANKVV